MKLTQSSKLDRRDADGGAEGRTRTARAYGSQVAQVLMHLLGCQRGLCAQRHRNRQLQRLDSLQGESARLPSSLR